MADERKVVDDLEEHARFTREIARSNIGIAYAAKENGIDDLYSLANEIALGNVMHAQAAEELAVELTGSIVAGIYIPYNRELVWSGLA